jgi:hypothetical protein
MPVVVNPTDVNAVEEAGASIVLKINVTELPLEDGMVEACGRAGGTSRRTRRSSPKAPTPCSPRGKGLTAGPKPERMAAAAAREMFSLPADMIQERFG